MFQIARPFFFICETPLHAGAGGGIGTELPIQREEHTQFPKIEASGIKGALREVFEQNFKKAGKKVDDLDLVAVFGHPTDGDKNAGALGLTDGRLLLFPVRSRRGVFAWVTCPRVLTRFVRDLKVSVANGGGSEVESLAGLAEAISNENIRPTGTSRVADANGSVFLEEYNIQVAENQAALDFVSNLANLLGIPELPSQFVIIPDDYFSDFVQHCTEIQTRIRIGENGVVDDGALFTEEHLPAESVLYSLAMAHPEFVESKKLEEEKRQRRTAVKILEIFENGLPEIVQIGGNATLGKGITRTIKTLLK